MSIGAPTKSKRLETRGYPGFGKRLKRLRQSVGYKQAYLAELLEVDQATVSRWERGGQTPPPDTQQAVFATLSPKRSDDNALRRLVMNSSDCLHLVEEASHKCLAYSASRARDWKTSQNALFGRVALAVRDRRNPEGRGGVGGRRVVGTCIRPRLRHSKPPRRFTTVFGSVPEKSHGNVSTCLTARRFVWSAGQKRAHNLCVPWAEYAL